MGQSAPSKLGIDQIIKVLDVVIEGGNVAEKIGQAKTVMGKLMALLPITDELLRLMSLSPVALKAQYQDLDNAEKDELRAHVKEKFDLDDDKLEAKVELGLELVSQAVDLVNKAMDYAKSFKKAS